MATVRMGRPMADGQIDIGGLVSLLWRQKRLIALVCVGVIAVAIVISTTLTPLYTANALVLVDTSRKDLLAASDQSSTSGDSARIDGEVEILKSESVLLRVIENMALAEKAEFVPAAGLREQVLWFLHLGQPKLLSSEETQQAIMAKLRGELTVQRRGLTNLIAIQARSESPRLAAEMANATGYAYIEDQLDSKIERILTSSRMLQSRIARARVEIVTSEGAFDRFIADNIAQLAQETGRADLISMHDEIVALEQTPVAPLLKPETVLATATTEPAPDTTDALRNDSRAMAAALRHDIRAAVLDSTLSPDMLTRIYDLQQNAELARSEYKTLLARANALETQADLQVADSRIVSPALPPGAPSFPSMGAIIGFAALAALGLGIGLAYLYEHFIGGFTSREQVEAVLKSPVMAGIPRQRGRMLSSLGEDEESLADLVVTEPLSDFAEAVRRIRAGIDQAMRKRTASPLAGGIVVMISSSREGEGKSTLALALARSYAVSGHATLLIDCDLRQPGIHRHLGIEPNTGLVDYLSDELPPGGTLNEILQFDAVSGVSSIVGARASQMPTDQLVTGRSFQRLLEAARRNFEVVILDTPPINPVVDGLYITPFADIVAFVIRWASTSQSEARRALAGLENAMQPGTSILTVLNVTERERSSYRRIREEA
jgi:succinoglycan biosynthesis transport protein ExoP